MWIKKVMKLSDNRFRLEILRMFEYRPEGGRDCEGDRRSGLPGAAVWLMGFGESEAALGYRLTKQTGSRWSRTAFGPCIHMMRKLPRRSTSPYLKTPWEARRRR